MSFDLSVLMSMMILRLGTGYTHTGALLELVRTRSQCMVGGSLLDGYTSMHTFQINIYKDSTLLHLNFTEALLSSWKRIIL